MMGREFPLEDGDVLVQIWQRNFCEYYRGGVYVVEVRGL